MSMNLKCQRFVTRRKSRAASDRFVVDDTSSPARRNRDDDEPSARHDTTHEIIVKVHDAPLFKVVAIPLCTRSV